MPKAKEEQLIDELKTKYPVYLYGDPATPDHLYKEELEQYTQLYLGQNPEADAGKVTAEIMHYADRARENDISVLPPKGNLQPDGLYYDKDKGKLILPGLLALKSHEMEERASRFQEAYDTVRHTEPLISRDVMAVIDQAGAVCAGLECSVKTGSSLSGKLMRDHLLDSQNPVSAIQKLNDVVRYTAIADGENLADAAKNIISQLSENGYQLFRIKNFFVNPREESGYRGLHFNFISPYGVRIEVQCHTEESFQIKSAVHKEYERARDPATPVSEKEALYQYLRKQFQRVPSVPDIDQIPSWKKMEVLLPLPDVFSEIDQSRHIETFSVIQNGCRLLSGIEQITKSGDISAAYSFDQENCTRIYRQKDGYMTGHVKNVSVDFTGKTTRQMIHDSVPRHDTQNLSQDLSR